MTKCFDRVTCISFTNLNFIGASGGVFTRCDLYDSLENAFPYEQPYAFYDKVCSTGTYSFPNAYLWSLIAITCTSCDNAFEIVCVYNLVDMNELYAEN